MPFTGARLGRRRTAEPSGIDVRHERKGGDDVEDRCQSIRCCARDGGWPPGIALQGEVSNHRKLRRSRAGVVSVADKAHL